MTRSELVAMIRALDSESLTEAAQDSLILRLDRAVPHARISDLLFYPERSRSGEEIADEALRREQIWAEGGDAALYARIEEQMHTALADTSTPSDHHTKLSARSLLEAKYR